MDLYVHFTNAPIQDVTINVIASQFDVGTSRHPTK